MSERTFVGIAVFALAAFYGTLSYDLTSVKEDAFLCIEELGSGELLEPAVPVEGLKYPGADLFMFLAALAES